MAFNLRIIFIIALIGILIFLVAPAFSDSTNVFTNPITQNKRIVSCDITLTNPAPGDPEISAYKCEWKESCLFDMPTMSLIDRGSVVLEVNGVTDKSYYSLFETNFGNTEFNLKVCAKENSNQATLTLFNEDGIVVFSRGVVL